MNTVLLRSPTNRRNPYVAYLLSSLRRTALRRGIPCFRPGAYPASIGPGHLHRRAVGRLHVLPRQPTRPAPRTGDHVAGCRQYFNVTRDTVTYEILETYKIGEKPQFTAKADSSKVPGAAVGEKV